MKDQKISRRDLLKMAALASVGGIVACAQSVSQVVEAQTATPWAHRGFLPFITRSSPQPTPTATVNPTAIPSATVVPTAVTPNPLGARVTHVHANTVTSWTGSGTYWTSVNQGVMDTMVETGLKDLTGESTLGNAWRRLIPNYTTGQKIAIKVNFNNSEDCQASTVIDAIIEPVNSLVKTLVNHLGVNARDVLVFDAMRLIPSRFIDGSLYPVTFLDACTSYAGFSDETIAFSGINRTERLCQPITNAHYLINMPIMKIHNSARITLGFKNHFGSIDDPGGLHDSIFLQEANFRTTYNPLVDIYLNNHIRYKTVLTVGDGIFGCLTSQKGLPNMWSTFGNQVPKSLFFSTDPVAIDSIMADHLEAELGAGSLGNAVSYLPLAQAAGLGTYEHSNPWNPAYQNITYHRIF